MASTFSDSPSLMLTSESVTEGHPDKLCDQISDAVLDALLEQDPYARVACEVAVNTGVVFVFGEISTSAWVDIPDTVRHTIREVGYDDSDVGFDWRTCGVISSLKEQAGDIARGVDAALEAREQGSEDPYDRVGAGDQGMMIGFACNETPDHIPLTIWLAHRLAQRLTALRKSGVLPYLRPDGKTQVTVEYEYGRPKRLEAVVVSTQHDPGVRIEQLREDVRRLVIESVCPAELLAGIDESKIYVNPTGRFVAGGPASDAGLTGRKIIVDTYGGIARHGGGAFSGKDPDEGRSLGLVRRPARRPQHRRGGAGGPDRGAGLLRDRCGAPDLDRTRDIRDREVAGHGSGEADRRALRPAPRRDHRPLRPAPPDLRPDGSLRALRPPPPRSAVGAAGHGGHAAPQRWPRRVARARDSAHRWEAGFGRSPSGQRDRGPEARSGDSELTDRIDGLADQRSVPGIYAFQVNAVADKKELVGKDTIGLVEVSIAAFIDARAAALAALRAAEDNKDHIGVRVVAHSHVDHSTPHARASR